jgi:hypothetical protein
MALIRIPNYVLFVFLPVIHLWSAKHALVLAQGGERALYRTPQFSADVVHRQNVCERSLQYINGEVALRDALYGMELHAIVGIGDFFNYNDETGIDPVYPGLAAVLLDEMALRGGFTWRNSFAVFTEPDGNYTWTDLLLWSTQTYDISIDYWSVSNHRRNLGISFVKPWYESSLVLVDKIEPFVNSNNLSIYTNWLKPFEPAVWYLILATICVTALVAMCLEQLSGQPDDRSWHRWLSDNLFLSFLNFAQNYDYEAFSFASRIFAVSAALWAMIMGATYTANLASLFVEVRGPPPEITSIVDAMQRGRYMCTMQLSANEDYIQTRFPQAKTVPKLTEQAVYQGLLDGECDLAVVTKALWYQQKQNEDFNPECDLKWVGREVGSNGTASFAVKFDPGFKCSSLIQAIIDLYMDEMTIDGFLPAAWDSYSDQIQGKCSLNKNRRKLISASAAGVDLASPSDEEESAKVSSLTLEQMAGTFLLHAIMSTAAMLIGMLVALYKRWASHFSPKDATKLADSPGIDIIAYAANRMRRIELNAIQNGQAETRDGLRELKQTVDVLKQTVDVLAQQMSMLVDEKTERSSRRGRALSHKEEQPESREHRGSSRDYSM